MAESAFRTVLRTLKEGEVAFVLVGGLASLLNGAPVDTFGVDIVPACGEENLAKLLRVLGSLDAIYRIQPSRRLKPDASHLRSSGHHNLLTNLGPVDVLGTIGRGLSYEDLLSHTIEMEIGDDINVRVLDLETI